MPKEEKHAKKRRKKEENYKYMACIYKINVYYYNYLNYYNYLLCLLTR
jgi:hypothetical protein